jgi:UDP-N-acetylglucosamine transferase subunit ALG13
MRSFWAQSSSDAGVRSAAAVPRVVATLVTAGTHEVRFHRLELAVADLASRQVLPAPVLVQTGSPPNGNGATRSLTAVDFLEPAELTRLMSTARFVITHGGPGSIFMALESGHRPIAIPRSAAHGEHIDDHQSAFVERMGERGLVHPLKDPSALRPLIASLATTRRVRVRGFGSERARSASFVERFAPIADAVLRQA